MPDRHKAAKSKYTIDRGNAGRLRRRDRHPSALHGRHRAHSRRNHRGRLHASGPRLRARPAVQPRAVRLAADRDARRLHPDELRHQGGHARAGHRRGRQVDRVRAHAQPEDRYGTLRPVQPVDCAVVPVHAPGLPGPLRVGRAALHLPVPRRRLRLSRHGRGRTAGAATRSLLHPAQQRARGARPALFGELRAAAVLAAGPGRADRRDRAVPVSEALLHLDPPQELDAPPARPTPSEGPAAEAEAARRGAAEGLAGRGRDHRRRLDRRAHVDLRRPALDAVPQGPERDQLGLHARVGDDVRVPRRRQ